MQDAYIYIYIKEVYIYILNGIFGDNRNIISRDDNLFCVRAYMYVCMCTCVCVYTERVVYFDGARTPRESIAGRGWCLWWRWRNGSSSRSMEVEGRRSKVRNKL